MKWRDEHGQSLIFFALALVVLMGFAAISFDVGRLYIARFHAQNAADAAALAGVQYLPSHPTTAINTAVAYAAKNGFTINANDPNEVQVSSDDLEIRVTIPATVRNDFAEFIGFPTSNIAAASIAKTGPLSTTNNCELGQCKGKTQCAQITVKEGSQDVQVWYCGVVPLGINKDVIPESDGGSCVPSQTNPCSTLDIIKNGSSSKGNFFPVQIDSSSVKGCGGANCYETDLAYGAYTAIYTGEQLTTEAGGMVGPTRTGLEQMFKTCTAGNGGTQCTQVTVLLPVVDGVDYQGESNPVTVVGLAAFAIDYTPNKWTATETTIYGNFVVAAFPSGNHVALTPDSFTAWTDGELTSCWGTTTSACTTQ